MRHMLGALALTVVQILPGTVEAAIQDADILESAPQVPQTLYCYPPANGTSNDTAPAARQIVLVSAGSVWHQDAVQRGYNCSPERQ